MTSLDKTKLLDNSKETTDNILKEKPKVEGTILYWVNAPKIDSILWIN